MKKYLTLFFVLSVYYCKAGTGSANDETLLILILMTVLLFVIAVMYAIDFFRRIIKDRKRNTACDTEQPIQE